ncbi:ferrochelatase [Arcobacter sp. FWKO B]|uniref:ferrochelatase n=1 Tax=Arcobacter sp. FWKO B TaxID=2593672 RepID=UPI0018A347CE|nr:ferrochelatase [Arcobacter sp. FWKO B]QOG12522.1 ferrochelatase [Arcobacter sp. FWKO B]
MDRALVLLNMGGPRNKEEFEMFLRNMFNDPNILTIKNDFLRSIIASLIVMSRKNSAWENYLAIGGSSPINKLTEKIVEKLSYSMGNYYVTWAMRYTPPFASQAVKEIEAKGIKDIVLLPMYPQYSTTTTKSSVEDFMAACEGKDFNITVIDRFYKNEFVNLSIVYSIRDTLLEQKSSEYHLIFSAHGLPQKIVDNGDPYQKEIQEHVQILSEVLDYCKIPFKSISLAYQSKIGPMKWLTPSLEDKLKEYKGEKVLIYPISFTVDNSETVFELAIEYKEKAHEIGIIDYKVCKCENDSQRFCEALEELVRGYK